jgi:hypothetical protein
MSVVEYAGCAADMLGSERGPVRVLVIWKFVITWGGRLL